MAVPPRKAVPSWRRSRPGLGFVRRFCEKLPVAVGIDAAGANRARVVNFMNLGGCAVRSEMAIEAAPSIPEGRVLARSPALDASEQGKGSTRAIAIRFPSSAARPWSSPTSDPWAFGTICVTWPARSSSALCCSHLATCTMVMLYQQHLQPPLSPHPRY